MLATVWKQSVTLCYASIMGRTKEPLARSLSKELGLTIAETLAIMKDPEAFAREYTAKVQAKHLTRLDSVLTALEKIIKNGSPTLQVRASLAWAEITGIRNMKNHISAPKNMKTHISAPVETAVKWLPGPTVDAKIIKTE